MTAILVVCIFWLTSLGWGRAMTRRGAQALPPHEAWMLAPLVGGLPLAAAIQAVGHFRYDSASMTALAALGAASALWILRSDVRAVLKIRLPNWSWYLAPAVLVWVISAAAAFAPPIDHDTIRYHLTLPRRDLELGRIALWFGWSIYEFFPPLASLHTRFAYALGGAEAAQLLNMAWLALAGGWVWALALRLGAAPRWAALGVLILFVQRAVLNLGPAVTVDMPLIALTTAACAMLAVMAEGKIGPAIPGLLLGAIALTRYQGLLLIAALAIPFTPQILRGRGGWIRLATLGAVAAALFAPIALRNYAITGNPVFPTFHPLFGPDNLDVFGPLVQNLETRPAIPGGWPALPWTMFILQDYFDGLQFGFPLFLLLAPFAFFNLVSTRLRIAAVCILYAAAWWVSMPHLLRFLLPVFGTAAALSACALPPLAEAAARIRWFKAVAVSVFAVAAFTQALFLGSSALYRLPAAFGLVEARQALETASFRFYSLVTPCLWLERNLRPGEHYLALINDPSFYCPQTSALHALEPGEAPMFYTKTGLPPVDAGMLAAKMRRQNVRYVLAAENLGADFEIYAFAKHRYDDLIMPLLPDIQPLLQSQSGFVYPAEPIIAALEQASNR